MASKSDSRRVSANVAVFIISFLIFTTLIVFAVLLFLSYENMLRMLSLEVTHGTRTAAQGLAIDIETVTGSYDNEFVYTVDNDGSAAFKNSRIVDRFINSNLYNNFGSVYLLDSEGRVLSRSSSIDNIQDSIIITEVSGGKYYISDEIVIELISTASNGELATYDTHNSMSVTSISCCKVYGTDYYCVVSNTESTNATRAEYLNVIFLPAMIAMVIAIVLYAVFVYLSLMPMKDISYAISRVAEGDFKVRVQQKYSEPENYSSFAVSSEFTEMGRTVNNMIESLENQEHDREIFISSIAHDIRTPLTSINGFVTAMLDGTIPPEKQPHYLELIKQQADRIRTLVTSMTEASSLSHVDPSMMEAFNINEMITDIVDNLEAQLAEKNIKVIKSLDPGPGIIAYGEAQQLCRVIINIITNAIKFTPSGGSIKVSTETDRRNNKIWISVEDSGAGVEESKRKRIFESFYKGDPSRKVEGFGLGLYICKQILAGHGQTIVCDEGTELGGAKFVFSFPTEPADKR